MLAVMSDATATVPASEASNASSRFLGKFLVLKGGMRELWLIFAIKLVGIAAYALTNTTIKLWLSHDFGYSDQKALAIVAGWSLTMTIITVLSGSLTDALGMKRTLWIGTCFCAFSRAVMAFVSVKWFALVFGLFPLAVGEALTGPVLVAGARIYSNTKQRSMSFSIVYMMMNIGFLVAGFSFDWVRKILGEHGHLSLGLWTLTTYQAVILVSLLMECAVFPLVFWMREGAYATDEGVKYKPKPSADAVRPTGWQTLCSTAKETVAVFVKLWHQGGFFFRLMTFLVLIAFLKLVLAQIYYVFPEYGIRVLGAGAPVGRLSTGINSIVVIALVPIVGALTQRFSAYSMVILGGIITAGSVFVMVMPTEWFAPAAQGLPGHLLGNWYLGLTGAVDPLYVASALFVIIFSVGEAFYSPRVYEYAAAIAPEGQEASYSALSYVPFLLAKLLTGIGSGTLLARYCPETGPRHPSVMWLIIGLLACISPVGLILLGRVIRLQEAGRKDD